METNKLLDPIIHVKDLCFSYHKSLLLHRVNFTIYRGEFIGIIGPNGGGKTTLLKLLMGFLQPCHGKIEMITPSLDNQNLKKTLAYVPQSMRYDKDFPICVEEVVLSGLLSQLPWYGQFRAKDKQTALEALEEVNLAHLSKRAFGTLSGGQAQRVLIARALVSKPQILLLDEPTASVDVRAEAEIYAILEKLKRKLTILMVTHDLKAAVEHVDRLICVQRNVMILKPEEVCEHFALGLYHQPLVQAQSHHLFSSNL